MASSKYGPLHIQPVQANDKQKHIATASESDEDGCSSTYNYLTTGSTGCAIATALAISINLAMVVILATVVFVPIRLPTPANEQSKLATASKTAYVIMLTVVGTACRSFTSSQIRRKWLESLDLKLSHGRSLVQVNPKWRTILGIGTIQEYLQQWRVSISFVVSALSVTAFVTGLNWNQAEETVPFSYYLPDDSTFNCMGVEASKLAGTQTDIFWTLQNGSQYQMFPNLDFCPTSQSMLLMGTINTIDPQNYGYGDLGVAVRRGALGATGSFYAPLYPIPESSPQSGLTEITKMHGTNLVSVHACAPVLSQNPFQCKRIDVDFNSATSTLSISSDDKLCSTSRSVNQDDGYTFKLCSQGDIGEGTLVIGHVGTSAIYAAEAIGDHQQRRTWAKSNFSGDMLYGIQCSISASIQTRNLRLTIADTLGTSGSFTRTLGAGADCSIVENFGINQLKATVVAGAFQPLYDGWIVNIRLVAIGANQSADYVRSGPFAFENSRSAIEDVLGLTAALSLSRVTLTGRAPTVEVGGQAVVLYNRVGPGKPWAILFVLPPLINAIVLIILWWKGRLRVPLIMLGITSDLNALEKHLNRYRREEGAGSAVTRHADKRGQPVVDAAVLENT